MGDTKRGHRVLSVAEIDQRGRERVYVCHRLQQMRQGETCSGLCDCPNQLALKLDDAPYHGPMKPPPRPERKAIPASPPSNVNLPRHYARNKIEPVYYAIENGLDNFQFQINKYNVRAYHKHETPIEDIKKILRYGEMWLKKASGDPDWAKPSTMVIEGYQL